MVIGTLLVNSTKAYVLFDSGLSHSFISAQFDISLTSMPERLDKPLYVTIPLKSIGVVDMVLRNCTIQIGERDLVAGLILLDMGDFDIIFGMNWLSSYYAHIDCYGKIVLF